MLHIISKLRDEWERIESDKYYFVWDSDDFSLEKIIGRDLLKAIEKISGFNNLIYLGGEPYILSGAGNKSLTELWNESKKVLNKHYMIYECVNPYCIFVLKNNLLYRVIVGTKNYVLPIIKNTKLKFTLGHRDSYTELIETLSIEYIGSMSKNVFKKSVILDLDNLCNKKAIRSVGGI